MPDLNSSLMGSTSWTFSGLNIGALIILALISIVLISLSNSRIFRRFIKYFGYIGDIIIYILEGLGVFLSGKLIYNSLTTIQENNLITWKMFINGIKWSILFFIIGYISHFIGKRIFKNFSEVIKEKMENEE